MLYIFPLRSDSFKIYCLFKIWENFQICDTEDNSDLGIQSLEDYSLYLKVYIPSTGKLSQ